MLIELMMDDNRMHIISLNQVNIYPIKDQNSNEVHTHIEADGNVYVCLKSYDDIKKILMNTLEPGEFIEHSYDPVSPGLKVTLG